MVRQPRSKERDAWKRWLRNGAKLFDRTFSGWAVLFWLFSLGFVSLASHFNHLVAVAVLAGLSAAAFGVQVAVFDVLASGRRGPAAWLGAIGKDLRSHHGLYLRAGIIRAVIVLATIVGLATLLWAASLLSSDSPDKPVAATVQPFWQLWSMWAWMWLIPAGWQKGGALGWGHWLVRREGVPQDVAEHLARVGIAVNARSYAIVVAVLMLPSIGLMMFFPPLIPVWDVYVAAVCWCVWDEVFGEDGGMKELEKKRVGVDVGVFTGA